MKTSVWALIGVGLIAIAAIVAWKCQSRPQPSEKLAVQAVQGARVADQQNQVVPEMPAAEPAETFVAANPAYAPIIVRREDFRPTQILGVVVGVFRRM